MTTTTVAHYKITAKIGKGGRGGVYRATNTKLDREVAIKILPESFAGQRNRILRFEREAKALAPLNPPSQSTLNSRTASRRDLGGRPKRTSLAEIAEDAEKRKVAGTLRGPSATLDCHVLQARKSEILFQIVGRLYAYVSDSAGVRLSLTEAQRHEGTRAHLLFSLCLCEKKDGFQPKAGLRTRARIGGLKEMASHSGNPCACKASIGPP